MNESEHYFLKESPGGESLDFPDWSGQQPHRSRVPSDEWLAYCRSNVIKLRARPGFKQGRRQHGIQVEFTL